MVINGRVWLSRDLQKHGIGYEQRDNAFCGLGRRCVRFILRTTGCSEEPLHYYWSADETEWATDVMFRSPQALAAVYPRLVRYAVTTFGGNARCGSWGVARA